MTTTQVRQVELLVAGRATSDGAGVKLTRLLTGRLQARLDPFLMLDAFASENPEDYLGGFPDHPHRGFEAITYMIAGRLRHRDSAGHEGLLQSGGMQWMTVGRGVVHSELPEQEAGLMEGFQLWLNLPAATKMQPAWYCDFPAAALPGYQTAEGVAVRVLAGESHGVKGAVQRPVTEPLYLDLQLPAGTRFSQHAPLEHNAFLYVYRGALQVAGAPVPERSMAILDNGAERVELLAAADSRVLLVAGRPLREPIAQHGPFVMNTEEELRQAIEDYQAGRLVG